MIGKLDATRSRLTDSRERPKGELRITTNLGFGTGWLTPRMKGFLDTYPDVKVRLILSDNELDLGMREADIAVRLREPEQPDLIRRRLLAIGYHLYASPPISRRTASRRRSTTSISTACSGCQRTACRSSTI